MLRIRFLFHRGTEADLEGLLSNIPLISNRSITLTDLEPYISGEFSLFFLPDGSRVVAVHSAKNHAPPPEWLDAVGIVEQEIHPGVFLLSDRLLSVQENPKHLSALPLPHPFHAQLGIVRAWENDNTYTGTLSQAKGKILLKTNIPSEKTGSIMTGPDTIAAMSTPASSSIGIDGLIDSMDVFAKPLGSTGAGWLEDEINSHGASIALSTEGEEIAFLLTIPTSSITIDQGTSLIRTLAALHMPTTREWTLPDQSKAKEIIIDPGLVTVEQQTIFGNPAIHASANGHEFDLAISGDTTLLGNNRLMMEQKIQAQKHGPSAQWCTNGQVLLDIKAFSALYDAAEDSWSNDLLTLFAQNVSSLVISPNFFGKTVVTLCQT